jgi:glycolate oxidase iron-sulfur subunit
MATTLPGTAACAIPGTPLAAEAPGLDACVHCGFCMQACPTYLALGDENDSPRGRLVLMRAVLEGDVPTSDPSIATHIDQCLGCRACESACPSGVPYGALLEATRATIATHGGRERSRTARLILGIFARPRLLAVALWATRAVRALGVDRLLARLPGRLGFAGAMLASIPPQRPRPTYSIQPTQALGSVALLQGCVMRGLFRETNRATERVLQANGYRVVSVAGQRCCGALHAHAGDLDGARALARTNIAAFEAGLPDYIATNAAGCGAMLKEYAHLLRDDPAWHDRALRVAQRARDASELLAAAGPRASGGGAGTRVTYDAPCHLLHAQRVTAAPLAALGAAGVELVPLADAEQCCGGAGIYNLLHPDISQAVLDAKLDRIAESGAPVVATGNPGCMMQIGAGLLRRGSPARVAHPVDVLDAAYAAAAVARRADAR